MGRNGSVLGEILKILEFWQKSIQKTFRALKCLVWSIEARELTFYKAISASVRSEHFLKCVPNTKLTLLWHSTTKDFQQQFVNLVHIGISPSSYRENIALDKRLNLYMWYSTGILCFFVKNFNQEKSQCFLRWDRLFL